MLLNKKIGEYSGSKHRYLKLKNRVDVENKVEEFMETRVKIQNRNKMKVRCSDARL